MKRNLKYLLILLLVITFAPSVKVQAATYSSQFNDQYMWMPDAYVNKKEANGTIYFTQLTMITRKSDNQFVYCMDPVALLYTDETYPGYDSNQAAVANVTQAQWRRIQLLAYYGYGYSDSSVDHSDLKWYSVTQVMIWQTVPHGLDIYFTDTLGGNKTTKYDAEMAEMEALLSKHYTTPDFGTTNINMVIGDTITLTDRNKVISNYTIKSNDVVTTSKSGNNLNITAKKAGTTTLELTKKDVKYSHPTIVYVKPGTQDIVQVGSYDPIDNSINIKVTGAKVTINKVDNETGLSIPQGQGTLERAVYGIYKEDGTFITQLVTDENGYAQSDYLPSIGRFYLQEISRSDGYLLDSKKYYFTINDNNLTPTVEVREQVVKNHISILKQYDYVDGETKFLNAEQNITFEIYNQDGSKFGQITTDKNGYALVDLPYGVWLFHQVNSTVGFEKIHDFYITVDYESSAEQYYNILNNKLSAYVQIHKVDSETGKTIALAGTTFRILNLDTNQYVTQYIGGKVYDRYITDETGKSMTFLKLEAGNYKIVEITSPKGYLINRDGVEFTIGDESHYAYTTYGPVIEVKFKDSSIKGQIEILKTGEDFIINNGEYYYESKNLEGVIFEIYAAEDILSPDNNHLYYSKGDLIDTIITNEDGYVISQELPLGKYYFIEVNTKDEYLIDNEKHYFELREVDSETAIVYESYSVLNYLKKALLEFTKTDLVSGEGIPNTIIEIYTEDDELIFTGTTDETGKIIINDLKLGKYYIIEKEAATGYLLTDEKVYFELKDNGEIIKAKMTNKKIRGSLEFTKKDISTGETLPNTLIEIYEVKTDKLIFSGRTDGEGKIIIDNLEYGKYYILEKEAPEGYLINEERMYFEILEDGQIIKATMEDEKIIEVPDTDKIEIKMFIIGGYLLILIGTGTIFYASKKRKK